MYNAMVKKLSTGFINICICCSQRTTISLAKGWIPVATGAAFSFHNAQFFYFFYECLPCLNMAGSLPLWKLLLILICGLLLECRISSQGNFWSSDMDGRKAQLAFGLECQCREGVHVMLMEWKRHTHYAGRDPISSSSLKKYIISHWTGVELSIQTHEILTMINNQNVYQRRTQQNKIHN